MCVYCNVKDATQKGRSFTSLLKLLFLHYAMLELKTRLKRIIHYKYDNSRLV